jgi:hypothetical protein
MRFRRAAWLAICARRAARCVYHAGMTKEPDPETVDTSALTDVDWAELDKLKAALETGGPKALAEAQKQLRQRDPICWFKIVRTFYPQLMRKIVGDDGRDGE